jgi:S-adenosylmethionine:tRNA ribosyltransferase-isomerase
MGTTGFTLDDFDFELPSELIAQYPEEKRDESRLFVLNRPLHTFTDSTFNHLPDFLREGDLLVFNDTKVISARIPCRRKTGGAIEILLTGRIDDLRWTAITNRTKRCTPGEKVYPINDASIEFTIMKKTDALLEIETNIPLSDDTLNSIGMVALPPYIKRVSSETDRDRYQTVYARESGAIAAPTAGLHFTNDLLGAIRVKGVRTAFLTLHVSWGTFQPVRVREIDKHRMHSEKYVLSEETAGLINNARRENNRVIAVGTTALRVLESTYRNGINVPGEGETEIFIHPPHKVLSADCLITNFHTPQSTLLMLVAAFAGYDTIIESYREAIHRKYRFFSYGDAMLII